MNVQQSKESSLYNSTAVCIFGWSASSTGFVARSSMNISLVYTPEYFSTCKVCIHPSALLCFGVYLTPHTFTGFSTGSTTTLHLLFSEHTYDIPLRDALSATFWVRGTLCCTSKGCMHPIGRVPPYWDITKSPLGQSTALTPIGWSF